MTYELYIGDYAYSSWSLRGWLLLDRFGLEAQMRLVPFADKSVGEQMRGIGAARTVPTLVASDGAVISESLAIAEELASRHPAAGLWPEAPAARALARSLAAEMASGFTALRSDCPMNLRLRYTDYAPSDAVLADVARLEEIWAYARSQRVQEGPWLLGQYSAADAFFAPVAGRIAGYSIAVSTEAQAYVDAHLSDHAFRRWRAMGLVHGPELPWYRKDYARGAWPSIGESAHAAQALGSDYLAEAVNQTCPYSGKPVRDVMRYQGKVYGFCNPFCRDKTCADPEAWPEFVALTRN